VAEIRVRRGLAAQAAANNPVLADGEPGWEKDTRTLKIGDGVTPWLALAQVGSASGFVTEDGHENFTFRVGSGPLPDPSSVPDTLYLMVPNVATMP
jgi:hypothetical protein